MLQNRVLVRICTYKGNNRRLKRTEWKLHGLYSSANVNSNKVKEDTRDGACSIHFFEDGHVASMSE